MREEKEPVEDLNRDYKRYIYGYCLCPFPPTYSIRWERINDGKPHIYNCVCKKCNTEILITTKGENI